MIKEAEATAKGLSEEPGIIVLPWAMRAIVIAPKGNGIVRWWSIGGGGLQVKSKPIGSRGDSEASLLEFGFKTEKVQYTFLLPENIVRRLRADPRRCKGD
jgi:hypothetical protein